MPPSKIDPRNISDAVGVALPSLFRHGLICLFALHRWRKHLKVIFL